MFGEVTDEGFDGEKSDNKSDDIADNEKIDFLVGKANTFFVHIINILAGGGKHRRYSEKE